jgi:hypothetical protein
MVEQPSIVVIEAFWRYFPACSSDLSRLPMVIGRFLLRIAGMLQPRSGAAFPASK